MKKNIIIIVNIVIFIILLCSACGSARPASNTSTPTDNGDGDVDSTPSPTPTEAVIELPTSTPAATVQPTIAPTIEELTYSLDIKSAVYMNVTEKDRTDDILFHTDEGIRIIDCDTMVYYLLPKKLQPGEMIRVNIVAKTNSDTGFRNYLINSEDCWNACSVVSDNGKYFSHSPIDISFVLEAEIVSDAITFRIPKFGQKIEDIEVKSIKVTYLPVYE